VTDFPSDDAGFRKEFIALKTELLEDVSECLELTKKSRSQFDIRNLVRSSFAAIEGLTWALKVAALRGHTMGRVHFDEGELAVLSEKIFGLKDNGKVKDGFARFPLTGNLRFAFEAFARANGVQMTLDCTGDGWEDFLTAKAIRNRLMHPKNTADLTLSKEDVNILDRALSWWANELSKLFIATHTT
jgi:hypothetical protein